MNGIFLIGNLTKAPEVGVSKNGKEYARLTLAVNHSDGTDFYTCFAFGKTGENALSYLDKGSKIALMGELKAQKYSDKNGVERTALTVTVSKIEYVDKKRKEDTGLEEMPF